MAKITKQERATNMQRALNKGDAARVRAEILSPKDRDRETLIKVDHSHPSSTNQHRGGGDAPKLFSDLSPRHAAYIKSFGGGGTAAHAHGQIQTSPKGARYYINTSGEKVYVK